MNAPSSLYRLHCDCGNDVKVASSQAGDELSCPCGRRILVPRLRELTKLPAATPSGGDTVTSRTPRWSSGKGMLFAIGLPITVLALGAAANYLRLNRLFRIDRPDPSTMKYAVDMQDLNPSDAWTIWKDISSSPPPARPQNDYIARRDAARRMATRSKIALAVSAFGAMIMLVSLLIPAPAVKKRSIPVRRK